MRFECYYPTINRNAYHAIAFIETQPNMKIIRNADLTFEPAAHENPLDPGCLKKILMRQGDIPEGRLQMVNWVFLKPQRAFEAHYHQKMTELFIILSGRVTVHVDERNDVLLKGDAIVIPPGAVHTMAALDGQAAYYLAMGIVHGGGGRTVVVPG